MAMSSTTSRNTNPALSPLATAMEEFQSGASLFTLYCSIISTEVEKDSCSISYIEDRLSDFHKLWYLMCVQSSELFELFPTRTRSQLSEKKEYVETFMFLQTIGEAFYRFTCECLYIKYHNARFGRSLNVSPLRQ